MGPQKKSNLKDWDDMNISRRRYALDLGNLKAGKHFQYLILNFPLMRCVFPGC